MYARNVFTTSHHQTIQQIKKKTASLLNAFPFWLNMMPKNVNAASLKCSKMQDDHAINSDINYTLASKLVSSTKQRGRTEWCKGQKVFWDWAQKKAKSCFWDSTGRMTGRFYRQFTHRSGSESSLPSTATVDVILSPSSAYKAHSSKNRSSIKVIIFSLKQQDFLSGLGGSERGDHLIKTGILQRLKINEVFPAPLTLTFTERWGIFSLAASGSERRLRPAERGAACGDVHINHPPPSCQSGWTWLTSPWWSPSSTAARCYIICLCTIIKNLRRVFAFLLIREIQIQTSDPDSKSRVPVSYNDARTRVNPVYELNCRQT